MAAHDLSSTAHSNDPNFLAQFFVAFAQDLLNKGGISAKAERTTFTPTFSSSKALFHQSPIGKLPDSRL